MRTHTVDPVTRHATRRRRALAREGAVALLVDAAATLAGAGRLAIEVLLWMFVRTASAALVAQPAMRTHTVDPVTRHATRRRCALAREGAVALLVDAAATVDIGDLATFAYRATLLIVGLDFTAQNAA